MTQKLHVELTLTLSEDRTLAEIGKQRLREYIREAVITWGGQYYPGEFVDGEYVDPDPLFYAFTGVKVSKVEELP